MKAYVQFYTHDLKNQVVPSLGSDGIHILDARLSVANMIECAWQQRARLARVKTDIVGFQIRRGNLRTWQSVYQSF